MSLKDIYKKAGVVMKPAAMKDGKLYSQQPHSGAGDFNFSRADGVQTRINKHGLIETVANNEPRLSYDIVDGKVSDCPHLLLEPQRTNLISQSEDIDSWGNQYSPTLTQNSSISPDGTVSAYKITATNLSSAKYIPATTVNSTQYNVSVFVKNINSQRSRIEIYNSPNCILEFNWTNNQPSTQYATTFTDVSYTYYGDDWWRVSANFTATATNNFYVYPDRINGTDSILVWGAQIEAGSYPTSYIPTSGSAEQRQADICNGSGNSETFNSSEGVLFVEFSGTSSDSTSKRITLNDGSTQNRVSVGIHSVSSQLFYFVSGGGSVPFTQAITVSSVEQFNKVAFKYKSGDTALWVNGTEVNTKTNTFNISGLDELSLNDGGNANPFYGKVKELTVINEALTDEQLQLLTTP